MYTVYSVQCLVHSVHVVNSEQWIVASEPFPVYSVHFAMWCCGRGAMCFERRSPCSLFTVYCLLFTTLGTGLGAMHYERRWPCQDWAHNQWRALPAFSGTGGREGGEYFCTKCKTRICASLSPQTKHFPHTLKGVIYECNVGTLLHMGGWEMTHETSFNWIPRAKRSCKSLIRSRPPMYYPSSKAALEVT